MANILKNFISNFNDITEYYNFLVNKTKNHEYVEITNEWLIDNYYILAEHEKIIVNNKKKLKRDIKTIEKNYYFLKVIANKKNYDLNLKYLTEELKKYQKETNTIFTYKQLSTIIPTLIIVYMERLNDLCREEYKKLVDKENVANIIDHTDNIKLESFISKDFDFRTGMHYLFEINNQLYKVNNASNLFKDLNEYLQSKQISLKDVVSDEFQNKINNNLLISNIFTDLKEFFEFSQDDLFGKVSKTEKLLLSDSIYKKMTDDSKTLYRKQLLKLAKKHHVDEYSYLEKIFDSNEHIGFKLFKHKNNTLKVFTYIFTVSILSILLSYFLAEFFIKPRILGTIILMVPISQLLVQIINELLIKFVPTNVLPKIDYSKGIPKESATMVVIPTIISTKEKIKEMFESLESYYLINKTDNLYFTLLGDVKASSKEVMPYDKELTEYGKEFAKKLNEKYKNDLFYFIYRKRLWNEKEGEFLGYERKRGALLQFNKILLGEEIDEEKYFNINTLHGNSLNIKYVITLDTDTKLVLNSALNLVGAMAHPLNRPVLNGNKTKVVQGYGIMQPRVGVDIEATNKSLYSQIFAGIGGFDTYSAVVPNVYQDTFGEGSFVGKGIYDLKIFNQVLSNTFPDNVILSHDLIEGNYIRCGYVSDVELLDDFPSKFLVDVTRQHRWARGDTQIIGWLGNKVPNKNNPNP